MAEDNNQNIYQKLARVRKRVEVVRKNKSGYNYKYVTDDELLAKITGAMDAAGLSLIPSIVPDTFDVSQYDYSRIKYDKTTKKNYEEPVHEMLVKADMVFTWVNNDNPDEKVIVPWVMTGHQADASQSLGSALTYAYRYFLLKFFGVATPEDDPDNWRAKQREAEMAEERSLAASIVATIDEEIKEYLKKNPKSVDKVKAFAAEYAEGGNYKLITASALATKMLEDFQKRFKEEG